MERKKIEIGKHRPLPRPERRDAHNEVTHHPGDFEDVPLRDAPELRGEARQAIGLPKLREEENNADNS